MYSISVLFLLHTMPWSKVVYQTFALRVQHSPVIARTLGLIQGKLEVFPAWHPRKGTLEAHPSWGHHIKRGAQVEMNGCVICGLGGTSLS